MVKIPPIPEIWSPTPNLKKKKGKLKWKTKLASLCSNKGHDLLIWRQTSGIPEYKNSSC